MKHIRRIGFCILLVFIAGLFFCNAAGAETRQKKKLVYVVADDSGSMENVEYNIHRWPKSLYAMEVLAGLLNPEDRLEIYFLNQGKHQNTGLSAGLIGSTMEGIRNKPITERNTPFRQIQEAYRNLVSESQTDLYDQYWLVIFTDGDFNADIPSSGVLNELKEYVSRPVGLKNKRQLQLIFCSIGDENIIFKDQDTAALDNMGMYTYYASDGDKSGQGVIDVMGKIADRISGRTRFTKDSFLSVDNRSVIQIRSDIPLCNFVVLVQGTEAKLESVSADSSGLLKKSREADVGIAYTRSTSSLYKRLIGSVYTVDNGKDNIPIGTYTLQFDRDIDASQVIVLFEPALEIRTRQFVDDAQIDGNPGDAVYTGGKYGVAADVYESGTANRIFTLDELPGSSSLEIQIRQAGKNDVTAFHPGQAVLNPVGDQLVTVTATLTISGFNPIVESYSFIPLAECPDPPIGGGNPVDEHGNSLSGQIMTVRTEEIRNGKQDRYIDFPVTSGGKPAENLDELVNSKTIVLDDGGLPRKVECLKNGVLRVYPQYADDIRLDQPYKLVLKNSKGEEIGRAEVLVKESEFVLTDGGKISIPVEKFKRQSQSFSFGLKVDGRSVKPNDPYTLMFRVLNGADEIQVLDAKADKDKYLVTVPWINGMNPGEYTIQGEYNGKKISGTAALIITESTFEVAARTKPTTVREAAFRKQPWKAEFTLKVDGTEAEASEYDLEFAVIGPDQQTRAIDPKTVERNGKSYSVLLEWADGMKPGTYTIDAVYGKANANTQITIEPSSYTLSLRKKPNGPVKEETFKRQEQVFEFTLKVDDTEVQANEYALSFAMLDEAGVAVIRQIEPERKDAAYTVRIPWGNDIKPGTYKIAGQYEGKQLDEQAALVVEESLFAIRKKSGNKDIKEIEFRKQGSADFTFALVVDGKEVNGNEYPAPIFKLLPQNTDLPVVLMENGQYKVSLAYETAKNPGDYEIEAYLGQNRLDDSVKFTVKPTEYSIRIEPESSIAVLQSKLADGGHILKVSLKEDAQWINPSSLNIDWGGLPQGTDQISEDGKKREIGITGDLRTMPGEYTITVSCDSISGNRLEQTITVTIQKSRYEITLHEPESTLLFGSVEELAGNTEGYQFDIKVDGRDLTETEQKMLDQLVAVEVEPNQPVAEKAVNGSGFKVTPKCQNDWHPDEEKTEFTVTCIAGAATGAETDTRSIQFIYDTEDFIIKNITDGTPKVRLDLLEDNEDGLVFSVEGSVHGKAGPEKLKGNYTAEADPSFAGVPLKAYEDENGNIHVVPKDDSWWGWRWLKKPLLLLRYRGEMTVTVTMGIGKNHSAEGTIQLAGGDLLAWLYAFLPWIVILLIFILILMYLFKKRFGPKARVYYYKCRTDGVTITPAGGGGRPWQSRYLKPSTLVRKIGRVINPFGRQKMTVEGLTLRAVDRGRYRGSQVEIAVHKGMTVKSIAGGVNHDSPPEVSDPVFIDPMAKGWQMISNESVIAVYGRNNNNVTLIKYVN